MPRCLLIGVSLVLCAASTGCRTGRHTPSEQDRRARTLFEDLVARGDARPAGIDDFGEGETFERIEETYADSPEPGASRLVPNGEPPAPAGDTDGGIDGGIDEIDLLGELVAEAETIAPTEPPLNPYLEFGQNIIWYELREGDTERLIMKPYPFPVGTGQQIFKLLQTYGDFSIHAAVVDGAFPDGIGPQPQGTVLLDMREGFSVESYSDPRPPALRSPQPVALSDVLFVTANASELFDVEHFIDLFAAEVEQIEIEAKIVEVTTRESLDIGVRPIDGATPIFGLPNAGSFVNNIDFSFANTADASEALFQLGAVFDGVTFNAILEAVASFENVSIISRPKVAVRAGGRADIVNVTRIPFYKVTAISASGVPNTTLDYQDVGVQMYVIPRVIGRNTVILNIDIEASQETGTAASFVVGGSVISTPQISKRNARTIVRLEPGQAVILGGLISERTVERETKIPFLGDVPLLGNLFRSKLTSKEQTNVLFFIRPRILKGSDLNSPFEE